MLHRCLPSLEGENDKLKMRVTINMERTQIFLGNLLIVKINSVTFVTTDTF